MNNKHPICCDDQLAFFGWEGRTFHRGSVWGHYGGNVQSCLGDIFWAVIFGGDVRVKMSRIWRDPMWITSLYVQQVQLGRPGLTQTRIYTQTAELEMRCTDIGQT